MLYNYSVMQRTLAGAGGDTGESLARPRVAALVGFSRQVAGLPPLTKSKTILGPDNDFKAIMERVRKRPLNDEIAMKVPDVPGLLSVPYLTINSVWELEELPGRIAIIGNDPNLFAVAQAFALLGAKVVIFSRSAKLIRSLRQPADDAVQKGLRESGVEIISDSIIDQIAKTDDSIIISYNQMGQRLTTEVTSLLVGDTKAAPSTILTTPMVSRVGEQKPIRKTTTAQVSVSDLSIQSDDNTVIEVAIDRRSRILKATVVGQDIGGLVTHLEQAITGQLTLAALKKPLPPVQSRRLRDVLPGFRRFQIDR